MRLNAESLHLRDSSLETVKQPDVCAAGADGRCEDLLETTAGADGRCEDLLETTAGADGRCEDLLETTWPSSDLTDPPRWSSAASELHFSSGSPEETPLHTMLSLPAAALCCLCSGECFQPIRSHRAPPLTNTVTLTFIHLSVSLQRWVLWQQS
ncbi:hypothetical protein VZT92_003512 [Zoarces viviparus]|uniref:Uncharacterized protein n=1 Tax=Zoarces viviparus TaxID=48416 RepID=A0AAW1FV58_ZOAVI